jgi:hypothetical protein
MFLMGVVMVAVPILLAWITAVIAPPPRRTYWVAGGLLAFVAIAATGGILLFSKTAAWTSLDVLKWGLGVLGVYVVVVLADRLGYDAHWRKQPASDRPAELSGAWTRLVFHGFLVLLVIAAAILGVMFTPGMASRYEAEKSRYASAKLHACIKARQAAEAAAAAQSASDPQRPPDHYPSDSKPKRC